jgi:hypothetical protein
VNDVNPLGAGPWQRLPWASGWLALALLAFAALSVVFLTLA